MKKNNFKTRLLCLLLSIFTLIPLTTQVYAVDSISNTDGHWAGETMLYWNSLGLFKDVPEDEFGIDKAISRGAFVHIFNRMIHVPTPESSENKFKDISETDWNYNDIVTAYNAGYINGYPNNTFKANSAISREEMCAIVSRYYDLAKVYDNTKLQNFTDKDTIQEYATDDVGALAELEIVKGYPSGAFKPQNNITWAEAVTIITRFLGYINGGSGVSGRVYYEDKPVYNAEITVFNNDAITIAAEALSDLYGDYIMDVPEGIYDITIKKDGKISMLADVAVSGDTRTYNKAELLPGQYVTGKLVDTKNNSVADKTLTFTGDSSIAVTTDAAGKFELTLPESSSYSIYAEVDGKIVELADFKTGSIESGLDLGDIILSSGKTTVKNAPAELPWWYLDSFFRDGTGKDNNEPDKKPDEDETPDYSKLPYREPKTMAELVELNGGVQPEIVVTNSGSIKVYVGKFSNIRITNSADVISELNNLGNLLNLTDSRFEFIPFNTNDGMTYKLQQVYNGVQVYDSQIIVSTDNSGYVKSLISYYNDTVKYSEINTTPIINENSLESILTNYTNSNINITTYTLAIFPDECYLGWDVYFKRDHINYHCVIDATTGEIKTFKKISIIEAIDYPENNTLEEVNDAFWDTEQKQRYYITMSKDDNKYYFYDKVRNIRVYNTEDKFTSFDDELFVKYLDNKNSWSIITSDNTDWDYDNKVISDGLYALHYFRKLLWIWKANTGFYMSSDNIPIRVYINLPRLDNAAYIRGASYPRFAFGVDNIKKADAIGHEFGHFISDYYIESLKHGSDSMIGYGTFGTGIEDTDSYEYKQAKAISEGIADIFGMLFEAIDENIDIHSEEFYYLGEDNYLRNFIRNHNAVTSDTIIKHVSQYYEAYEKKQGNLNHYDGCYILVELLRYIIDNSNLNAGTLLELWRCAVQNLTETSTFIDLYYALYKASADININRQIIMSACNHVGIMQVQKQFEQPNKTKWYTESFEYLLKTGIIDGFANSDGTFIPKKNINQKDFIQLVIDFCNTTESKLKVSYTNNTATLSIKSSNQSMSLLFDESKDILRWEAFIITDRILNFYHEVIEEYKMSVQYNYPYLDNTTKDKAETYAEFIDRLLNSETAYKKGFPNVDATEVLNRYYGGLTYDQFYESYMYVRNSANAEDNTKYDFSGDDYQLTASQRVVLDSMYNIYMSLGKKLTPVVSDSKLINSNNDVIFNVCKPMTLASSCYLLYAYIKK